MNNSNKLRHDPRGLLRVCESPEDVALTAADLFVSLSVAAIAAHGRFRVALSGGSTPRRTYELLSEPERASRVDWKKVHIFWGDERNVSPDDVQSNYRLVSDALLNRVAVPTDNVHRVRTELETPCDAAMAYEDEIRQCFGVEAGPRFDLALLGLGTNGHTASLFPYSPALNETTRLVVSDFVAEVNAWRITMTVPLLNAARTIAFLIVGEEKAQVLFDVLRGGRDVQRLPAQLINPDNGNLLWIADRAAARLVL